METTRKIKVRPVWLQDLIKDVNEGNRLSTCSPLERAGWNSLLVHVLMSNNTYRGFAYLTQDKVPASHLPGIVVDGDAKTFPDETRVMYF